MRVSFHVVDIAKCRDCKRYFLRIRFTTVLKQHILRKEATMKTIQHNRGIILAVIFTVFLSSPLFAQDKPERCVRFKDGTTIRGTILEMNADVIRIETQSGITVAHPFDSIDYFCDDYIKNSQLPAPEIKRAPKVVLPRHTWEIRPELSYIKYEEPEIMEEDGFMYGIGAAYTYHNKVMARLDGRYSYGKVDYQNSGTLNNIEDYMVELRMIVGYDFPLPSGLSYVTTYFGFGYRYLNDDSSGMVSSTGARGYERESNYYYSPIGVTTYTSLGNGWSYGVTVEYDIFWKGKQKSHLSDVGPGYDDIENDQEYGDGFRASLKIEKQVRYVSFFIEPFFRYWSIKRSDIERDSAGRAWVEPKNKSTEIGLSLAMCF